MTPAQVVETSVTVNNSPIQDYVHLDDHTQPTYEMTTGFKPFTKMKTATEVRWAILIKILTLKKQSANRIFPCKSYFELGLLVE